MERMTTNGRRWAFLVALLLAFMLPKRIDGDARGKYCTSYEIKPLGFYLIDRVFHSDSGFAYSQQDCQAS